MRDLGAALTAWLQAGGREIGEIVICAAGPGFELCHREERGLPHYQQHHGAQAALQLANFDDAGRFRPLKTAPSLRHGWKLLLADLGELRQALDYFYPAMLGVWHSHARGELVPVPLRTTLGRQTGMYRITQKLSDLEAQELVGSFCRSSDGCLKHLLWSIAPQQPMTSLPPEKLQPSAPLPSMPLLCQEACNLLVAKAREVVKKTAAG